MGVRGLLSEGFAILVLAELAGWSFGVWRLIAEQ